MLENKNQLGMVIIVAITFIVAAALITGIANPISEFDDILTADNESVTLSSGSAILSNTPLIDNGLAGSVITTNTVMTNGTNNTIGTNNYNVFTNGSVILTTGAGSELTNANVNLTYTSFSDTFVSGSTNRTIINLVLLFFAIGILAVGIMYVRGYWS